MSSIIELADSYARQSAYGEGIEQARAALIAAIKDLESANRDCVDHFNQMRYERDAQDALRERMSSILTATANALKGDPDELSSHGWHDLAEVAQALVKQRDDYQRAADDLAMAHKIERDDLAVAFRLVRETLESDAARYRWLRDTQNHECRDSGDEMEKVGVVENIHVVTSHGSSEAPWTYELDAAIDAAMRGET